MTRRSCLILLPTLGCGLRAPAGRFLPRTQSKDGGWHSSTYGLLRSGQSLTPFVLLALLRNGGPKETIDRGIAFLHRHINAEGALGCADPMLPDYPNYSTALAVQVLCVAKPTGWRERVSRMTGYLRSRQFTEANGWKERDAPFGAWGMGGDIPRPPFPGHVDLSMTRVVLQALEAAGVEASDPAMQRARVYLTRCQNDDGGFHFSTVVPDANKAGEDGNGYRSYGTATADGVLSLLAAGIRNDRTAAAAAWLRKRHRPDGAPGFEGDAYRRWPQGLRFYYAAGSAEAFRRLGMAADEDQRKLLLMERRDDGSWRNPEPLVKEDDPLIATAFALSSLPASY